MRTLDEEELERRVRERTAHLLDRLLYFQTLARASPVGLYRTDAEGGYVYVNERWTALTGLDPIDARGRGWVEAVHPDDRERIRAAWSVAVRERGPFVEELRYRRPDGSTVWVISEAVPEVDDTGRVLGYVGTDVDISARRRVEDELRRSQARLAEARRITGLGSWEWDVSTGRVSWSAEVCRILERPTDQPPPDFAAFLGFTAPPDRDRVEAAVTAALERGDRYSLEHGVRLADGREKLVAQVGEVLLGPGGKPERVLGLLRDITDERQLKESIRRVQKLEALGTLAGGLAHDCNNVLTAMMNFAELIETSGVPPAADRYARQIVETGRRGAVLISRILAFSRASPSVRRPLDVVASLREVLELVEPLVGRSVDLVFRLPEGPLWVECDSTELHQVVMNLCTNAAHAMQQDGRLEVSLAPDDAGRRAVLAVRDTGAGMPEGVRSRIFDPFFTTKPLGEGTGLGLSVVHGIVADMGGSIDVSSAPGEGTVFEITLPTCAPPRIAPSRERVHPARRAARVLFVDDEPPVRRSFRLLLRRRGLDVHGVQDGQEALDWLRAHEGVVDVVVTDLAMPRVGGLELAAEVRRLWPAIPVILLTGHGPDAASRAGDLVTEVLTKPSSADELIAAIARALDAADPARSERRDPTGRGDGPRGA